MKIKKMKIAEIKFSDFSQKIYDPTPTARYKRTAAKFGILELPVVDQHGNLISGHQRLMDALARGKREIEVRVLEINSEEERQDLIIAYNTRRPITWKQRLGEIGYYEERLKKEYDALKAQGSLQIPSSVWMRGQLEEIFGVSHDSIAKAKKVAELCPELLTAVDNGSKSINAAYNETQARHPEAFVTRKSPASPYTSRSSMTEVFEALGYVLGQKVNLEHSNRLNAGTPGGEALLRGLVAGVNREPPGVDVEKHRQQVTGWCGPFEVKEPRVSDEKPGVATDGGEGEDESE